MLDNLADHIYLQIAHYKLNGLMKMVGLHASHMRVFRSPAFGGENLNITFS
jgi:hypothetical protein